jgi:acetyl esterase/lipase
LLQSLADSQQVQYLPPRLKPSLLLLKHLPPLLVHAGEDEILHDDAIRIASLAKSAGVDVRLEIYPRMWHVWQINLNLPQAIQSLEDIEHFFKIHLELVKYKNNVVHTFSVRIYFCFDLDK